MKLSDAKIYNAGWDYGVEYFKALYNSHKNDPNFNSSFLVGFTEAFGMELDALLDEEDDDYGDYDPDEYGTAVDSSGHGAHSRVSEDD
jgi:hypothetical protein